MLSGSDTCTVMVTDWRVHAYYM